VLLFCVPILNPGTCAQVSHAWRNVLATPGFPDLHSIQVSVQTSWAPTANKKYLIGSSTVMDSVGKNY